MTKQCLNMVRHSCNSVTHWPNILQRWALMTCGWLWQSSSLTKKNFSQHYLQSFLVGSCVVRPRKQCCDVCSANTISNRWKFHTRYQKPSFCTKIFTLALILKLCRTRIIISGILESFRLFFVLVSRLLKFSYFSGRSDPILVNTMVKFRQSDW